MLQGIRKVVQEQIAKQGEASAPKYTYDPTTQTYQQVDGRGMKKGGKVSSASKRADGCAVRGKTKGRIV